MTADHARVTAIRLLPPEIVEAAAGGDAAADATVCRYERRMARALAGVINVLDPDVIVLGGGMSNIERLHERPLWGEFIFSCGASLSGSPRGPEGSAPPGQQIVETRLVPARHGDASGVRGAAWLWLAAP
jgi:predicted NBD/HSP70 family sugar kinase